MTSTLIISREQLEILLSGPPGEAYLAAKKELRALLAAPVVEASNKCGRCGASTVEGCNYLGCYFLESGNGAPVVESREPAAWANDQQLLLCSKSPKEDQPKNPMMHNLPRNIAGSALKTDYCNTPLFTSPPAPVALKDHDFRELVNRLRDTAIQYRDAEQLRERISMELRACLDKIKELNQ